LAAIVRKATRRDNQVIGAETSFLEWAMQRWCRIAAFGLVLAVIACIFVLVQQNFNQSETLPLPVPDGDQEVAWLHNPTSFESWENFVWGVKRAEMLRSGFPNQLDVDDSQAFPSRTTEVPEIVIHRKGQEGKLRIRWYKFTSLTNQETWITALARRHPPPLAVIGGWSSDRAHELAEAMRNTSWSGSKPVLLLTQATADIVYPNALTISNVPNLISVYERSFRFCFTNRQIAETVVDFVLSDTSLRPGQIGFSGVGVAGIAPFDHWSALATIVSHTWHEPGSIPTFTIAWNDDPYSTDLNLRFRESLRLRTKPPQLQLISYSVPFSTGRLNRPNRAETEVVDHILAHLPSLGHRSLLVIPTVSAPARRTIRALVEGDPKIGARLVAITGDGLSVNTFFRDRDYAWPVRSLPVPIVLFTHANPFGWDLPGVSVAPPLGYELIPPKQGEVRSTTEDIHLFARLAEILTNAVFPEDQGKIVDSPDLIMDHFRSLSPAFFDAEGNRRSGTGEHIVVLRPALTGDQPGPTQIEGTLEVFTRLSGDAQWTRIHTLKLGRSYGGFVQ
jgi:hypothetical protein